MGARVLVPEQWANAHPNMHVLGNNEVYVKLHEGRWGPNIWTPRLWRVWRSRVSRTMLCSKPAHAKHPARENEVIYTRW